MPFNPIHEEGQTVDLVEQMRCKAGAVDTPPDRANRPLNTAQRARDVRAHP
jgi:hypothetical protein